MSEPTDGTTPSPEDIAITTRRTHAGVHADAPRLGLALSGGGIRSATFCLGLLRALARNGVLHRFDYLSTVSGGGYVGSMLGRLFQRGSTPRQVEEGLADDGSLLLWWLRNNGRFLAPAGAADLLQALASQLRGFLATQVEVMVLVMLFACAITLPHLGWSLWSGASTLPLAVSLWWWLLPVPAAIATTMCYAYWFLGRESGVGVLTALLATLIGGYLAVQACASQGSFDATVLGIGAIVLLPSPIAWVAARVSGRRHPEDGNRVRYTAGLAFSLKLMAVVLALGAFDMVSWFLRVTLEQIVLDQANGHLATGVGAAAFVVAIARLAVPMLQGTGRGGLAKLPWALLANVVGIVLVVLVALFWLTIFQTIIFPDQGNAFQSLLYNAWVRWLSVAVVSAAYIFLNGRLLQQLNRSSLHFFYRSRLARAYVSVGNFPAGGARDPRFKVSPLSPNSRGHTEQTTRVTRLLDGDDICMEHYHPHRHGGPVHLVNCCINQTVDDRTGNFNADRKGVCLTVSSLGVETGTHGPVAGAGDWLGKTTLAEWVAISGAALGSGMGSMTRPGVAALSFLSGLRLGYWQENLLDGQPRGPGVLSKYRALLQEMFARFPGLRNSDWYLSDGGHFDNTGVYALLKRRLPLIVLADCGADPDYLFADVENLTRKARIDYDATIEFVDPASLAALAGDMGSWFGTPDSIVPGDGSQRFALARITYGDGSRGTLLVVKPRRVPGMPLDVAGYADREADFPQQSTSNQFFSEAEWESYCELGVLQGSGVTGAVLDALEDWAWTGSVVGAAKPLSPPAAPPTRAQRIATTVGASLGAGALITGVVAGWQAWDSHRDQQLQWQGSFTSEARNLLQYLTDPARAQASFTFETDANVSLLTASVGNFQLSARQAQTMQDLSDLLQPMCDRTRDAALYGMCGVDVTVLSRNGREPTTPWGDAMANYVGWQDRNLGQGALAGMTAASGGTPAPSSPAPAPPPPPAVTGGIASAISTGAAPTASLPTTASPAAAPSVAAPRPVKAPSAQDLANACHPPGSPGFVMYTQIYDESQRPAVTRLLDDARRIGVSAPAVENVTATALRNNRKSPFRWKSPTLLYGPEGKACAQALAAWITTHPNPVSPGAAQAVPLPSWAHSSPNTLELWLPRGN